MIETASRSSLSRSDHLVSLCDLFATMADILEVSVPEDAAEDSFSLQAVFKNQQSGPLRPYLLQQGFGGRRWLAIRSGKWKYLDHAGSGGNNYEKHPLLKSYALEETVPGAESQLYDLQADPGETENLIRRHPEMAERLRRQLHDSIDSGRSRP